MEVCITKSAFKTGCYSIAFAVLQTPRVNTSESHSIRARQGICRRGSVTRRSRPCGSRARFFCGMKDARNEKSGKRRDHPITPNSGEHWRGTGLYFPNMTESDRQYLEDASTSEEYLRRMGQISQRIQTERARNQPPIGKQSADDYVNSLSGFSNASGNTARNESIIDEDYNGRNEGENYMMKLTEQSKSKKSVPKLRNPFDFDDDMQRRNAGEEYIAQLAKQSSRKKSEPSPVKVRDSFDIDDDTQGRNAGEEYVAQLANKSSMKNSASSPGKRDVFDDAQRRNVDEEYIAQLMSKSASTASNLAAMNTSRESGAEMGEDDSGASALNDEIARLEVELAALESDLEIASEKVESDRAVQEAAAKRTERFRTQDVVSAESDVKDEKIPLNGPTAQELDAYSSMRDMLSKHVSPPSSVAGYDDIEASGFESAFDDNGVKMEDVNRESSSGSKMVEEGSAAELALVEIQIEMERYKIAARSLLEKHEQHIQTIIEKYMPGL